MGQKVKSKHIVCHELYCEREGETTSDRQKWKEELERYSSDKYQDGEMRRKAKEELDEWDERGRRWEERIGGRQGPRLTMSVLVQSRASFPNGKAVGIDGISAEILKSVPWRALQKIRKAFEMRYLARNKEEIETWLRNTIVLIPEKKTMNRLEGQTRGICVQSVLAKWYCGCPSILLEMELREVEKETRVGETSVSLVLKKEEVRLRSPLPLGSWRRQQREWGPELGFITCSLDVKQAFDNVSSENLSLVMKEMGIDPILARAMLREQIGGKYDISFQEIRITGIPFDISIKQ